MSPKYQICPGFSIVSGYTPIVPSYTPVSPTLASRYLGTYPYELGFSGIPATFRPSQTYIGVTMSDLSKHFIVERIVTGHAYARNGNAHRPTEHVRWVVRDTRSSTIVSGTFRLQRDAVQFVRDYGQVSLPESQRIPRSVHP
jgi:hypothetical protein